MNSNNQNDSDIVNSVRNMAISRRGGVRTRGGRLPPISMRDLAQVTGTKKAIAPKIPQRRVTVKKEVTEPTERVPLIKTEAKDESRRRDRGKGRGSAVILQTEGTFLAQGPAAKAKRDPSDYETFSIPRSSANSFAAATSREKYDIKRDPEAIKSLLKSDSSDEDGDSDVVLARRFPPDPKIPLTKNLVPKIKQEPLDENDIKPVIKKEPEDEDKWNVLEGKYFSKLEMDLKTEAKNAVDEFCNVKDKGMLMLLKLPDRLPVTMDPPEDYSKDDKEKAASKPLCSIKDLPEGYIGKLQILKSGRKRIIIGSVVFDLEDGTYSDAMQEVVTIRMNDDEGDLTVLGKIQKKMKMTPAIDDLIEAVSRNRKPDSGYVE